MFYSDFSPRDVCQIQCTNAQNKNFKLFLVRVLAPSRGEKPSTEKSKIFAELTHERRRGLWEWTKLYKMRVLCDFGGKNDALIKDAKTAQNTPFCKAISCEMGFANYKDLQNAKPIEPKKPFNFGRYRARADFFALTY